MARVHAVLLTAVALAVMSSMAPAARAFVPSEMTVQGILTDPSGTPQTGTFTFIFKIYDAAAGGSEVWPALAGQESQSITTDAEGRWTARVGVSSPLTDGVFSSIERWLEITVDDGPGGNPTETLARTKLNTNPYTYRSSTVDGASGGTISGDVTVSGGNVGLDMSTTTDGNILKGGSRFIHNYGTQNTFIGVDAGNMTMSGINNFGGGLLALASNTFGSANTASGARTLERNTSGFSNTACGYHALGNNTTGNTNTATGDAALLNNTTGNSNTACGVSVLNRNITGGSNTASGANALFTNDIGNYNTATGAFALFFNTSGNFNTGIGLSALYRNTTGSENTAIGVYALDSNTTGSNNTASGVSALRDNTTGDNNTATGTRALQSNTTGSLNTASGQDALYSNTTGGGNIANGPNALRSNTIGNDNTAIGTEALFGNTDGSGNTASGYRALNNNMTGVNNTAIGANANVSTTALTNATALGAEAVVDASNKIRLGNAFVTVIEGQVAYTFTSDKNQKENFQPVDAEDVLNKLQGLDLSSWNYKGQDPQRFRHYGPVAQEFFEAFGHDGVGISGTPTTINSGDQAGILMIAVQAQQKQIEDLKAEIEELKRLVVDQRE